MSTQNKDLVVFLALVLLLAAWVVVHLAITLRAARMRTLAWPFRAFALLPPVTPVAGFMAGARVRAALWIVLGTAYLVLRTRS